MHTVRTGEPAFSHRFGRTFGEDLWANPARATAFDRLMSEDVAGVAPAIAAARDWGACGRVVDVGGGEGTLPVALLRAHPELRGTVIDLDGPVEQARRNPAEAGLDDRGDAVVGDFFEPLPGGAAVAC